MSLPDDIDVDVSDLGADPGDPGASQSQRTFTSDQVSAIVRDRLAADRRSRGPRPSTPGGPPTSNAADIARRVAAFLGAGYGPDEAAQYGADLGVAMPPPPPRGAGQHRSAPPPAQPPGSPPARVITADTPIVALSREDQAKLAKQLGPFEFKKRLLSQLAESGQRFRLNR